MSTLSRINDRIPTDPTPIIIFLACVWLATRLTTEEANSLTVLYPLAHDLFSRRR